MQNPNPEKVNTGTTVLRYKLREKLYALESSARIRIKKRILKEFDISESSFSRYINVRKDDTYDIPALVLMAFAAALNVEVEDLKS